jgi:hypothetical protein
VFIDGMMKEWGGELVGVDYAQLAPRVRRRARACSSDSASRRTRYAPASDAFGIRTVLRRYRRTALDRDDAMVLGVGKFRAEEQIVRRQMQVEAATWRSPELSGDLQHVSADAAILAREVEVKGRDRYASAAARSP